MPSDSEPPAVRVAAAPARTVAAGTARLFAGYRTGSTVFDAAGPHSEGVADLAARRAHVWQVTLVLDGVTMENGVPEGLRRAMTEPKEMIYDGANAYIRMAGHWTGWHLVDPSGPRGVSDPLWPLDALFGARDDAVETGREDVRGVAATRYRLSLDLARADAAVPAGVSVPAGPYRALSAMPAEVWLDGAGLARRMAVADQLHAVAGEPIAPIWSVVELWDFGLAVDITPPRADEVVAPREAYRDMDRPPG